MVNDRDKTKRQLIDELVQLRQRISELEDSEIQCNQAEQLRTRTEFSTYEHRANYIKRKINSLLWS